MANWKPLNRDTIQAVKMMNETMINEAGINKMAPICLGLNKKVGDIVRMLVKPTGGTAPYTASFKKGDTQLKQVANLSEGQITTYEYTLTNEDANLTQKFSSEVTDSCPSGAKSSVESCDITIGAITPPITPTPIVCSTPVCNLVIT